jgi:hypothetical protein
VKDGVVSWLRPSERAEFRPLQFDTENRRTSNCAVRHNFNALYVGLRTVIGFPTVHSDIALCKEVDASLRSVSFIVPLRRFEILVNRSAVFCGCFACRAIVVVALPGGLQGRTLQWKCN